jgi:hypothetical protein
LIANASGNDSEVVLWRWKLGKDKLHDFLVVETTLEHSIAREDKNVAFFDCHSSDVRDANYFLIPHVVSPSLENEIAKGARNGEITIDAIHADRSSATLDALTLFCVLGFVVSGSEQ